MTFNFKGKKHTSDIFIILNECQESSLFSKLKSKFLAFCSSYKIGTSEIQSTRFALAGRAANLEEFLVASFVISFLTQSFSLTLLQFNHSFPAFKLHGRRAGPYSLSCIFIFFTFLFPQAL